MRSTSVEYTQKVMEELSIYQQAFLNPEMELTDTQKKNLARIKDAREWLLEGYPDITVLKMFKTVHGLQERRAREIVLITYEIFAELRRSRDLDAVKFIEAEVIDKAAENILKQAQELVDQDTGKIADVKDYVALMNLWKSMKKESATIKGAYEPEKIAKDKTPDKPAKFVFISASDFEEKKRVQEIINIDP